MEVVRREGATEEERKRTKEKVKEDKEINTMELVSQIEIEISEIKKETNEE